ncbi:RidA family protein [Candidatus Marinimicrobia bacterium]|nr:RidA family protein [Candidatus Neomarinimicrobiota bacterium]
MNQITALLITIVLFSCEPINTKKVISTDKAPQAIGPYSQAIQVNKTLYLAGQIALNPDTGQMVEDKIEVQTHRVMKNLGAVLSEAGFSFDNVVQSQVFLSDLNHYKQMNKVYAEYFSNNPPARAVVEVALPRNALVEIMMVAQKP